MTCAQGLLHLLWGGGARSWSATGLFMRVGYRCDFVPFDTDSHFIVYRKTVPG